MEYRKLSDLKKLEKNPRIITKEGQKKLTESLESLWFLEGQPIVVSDRTGELIIVSGNQRYEIAKKLGMKEVPTELLRVIEGGVSRMPTEQEEDEAIIRLNVNNGDWNYDMLSNWDKTSIIDWMSDDKIIEEISWNNEDDEESEHEEDEYSKKIEAPIYDVKNEKPNISSLYNTEKSESLIAKIWESNLDDDEKEFLIKASYRHNIFEYWNIADYYAHSSKEFQELAEQSALVIIDFDKAIEDGYVKLSNNMKKLYTNEHPNG